MHWSWIGVKRVFPASGEGTRSAEADLLRSLFEEIRAHKELTPPPLFYERVLSRIEQVEGQSIWIPFIYSRFRMRLVTLCLGLSFAALSYVFATEWNMNDGQNTITVRASDAIFNPTDVQQERDAVLIQFAAYRKPN